MLSTKYPLDYFALSIVNAETVAVRVQPTYPGLDYYRYRFGIKTQTPTHIVQALG